MSRSFLDDSWKESYDLEFKKELLSEKNWCENVEKTANEDMVIHIRLKHQQHLPDPESERINPSPYGNTHLAVTTPLPPTLSSSYAPQESQNQFSLGQEIGAQGGRSSILAPTPYRPFKSRIDPEKDQNPYSVRLPSSYFSQPMGFQPRFTPEQPIYGQRLYGDTSAYSTPTGLPFTRGNRPITYGSSPGYRYSPAYSGYAYRSADFETKKRPTHQWRRKSP